MKSFTYCDYNGHKHYIEIHCGKFFAFEQHPQRTYFKAFIVHHNNTSFVSLRHTFLLILKKCARIVIFALNIIRNLLQFCTNIKFLFFSGMGYPQQQVQY